jgi:hypothetical protein
MNVPAHTVRWTPRTDAPEATPSRHPPLDGCSAVNVGELSAGRWTAQSSIDEGAELCFSQPTRREPSPWWTIDLGEPSVIEHLDLSLGALPSGCEVRIDGYTYPSPSGAPPVGCHHQRWDLTALEAEADGSLRARAEVDWVARFVRVQLVCASAVTLHVRGLSLRGAVVFASTLRGSYERAFTLFADRPLVLARGPDSRGPFAPVARYRDVWEQGRALSLALAARLEVPSHDRPIFVGLCLKNGPAWLLGELACVLRGYVSVSLSPEDPPTRIEEILARCPLDAVLCEPECAPAFDGATRARGTIVISVGNDSSFVEELRDDSRELAQEGRLTLRPLLTERHPERPARAQDEEAPCAILFTSGSTGSPKGAARSFRKMLAILRTYGVGQVGHHLSFQPLSHLSERHYLPATILHGARVGFCADSGSLLTDLRDFEPSWVSSVPRLYEVVRGRFERAVSAARAAAPTRDPSEVEREVLRSFRGVFGGRLQGVAVGSAPVSDELRAFLRALFPDLWVVEGYGSTEVGTITGN